MTATRSHLTDTDTGGLGEMVLEHPSGTFAPSPASRVTLRAVGRYRHLFRGVGVDWGCGVGALAIALARIETVEEVVGVDVVPANIAAATRNAGVNGVAESTRFFVSDSFEPPDSEQRNHLDALRGSLFFVVANPPASVGDDGFSFRRRILAGARERVCTGGYVVMQAVSAYGPERVDVMVNATGGFAYGGVIDRSEPVLLDVGDPRMMAFLETYVAEESRGGLPYRFFRDAAESLPLNATGAMARFLARGARPWVRWQVHLFRRTG